MKRIYAFLGILLLVVLVACGGTPTPGDEGGKGGEKDPPKPIVPTQNIKELLKTNESLSLFTQALERANLLDILAGEGPYTVFVPDDNAVKKAAELERMNEAEYLDQVFLANVVKYHIVTGKKLATDFKDGEEFTTLQKYPVTVEVRADGTLYVEAAKITSPDALATNGVAHIIDAVLIPRALGVSEYPLNATNVDSTNVLGKVMFNEVAPDQTEVILNLTGVPADAKLTAHIHSGPVPSDVATDSGEVVYNLTPIAVATGESQTTLEGDPATLFNYDGYLTVHSATGAVVAFGGIGANGAEPDGRHAKPTR